MPALKAYAETTRPNCAGVISPGARELSPRVATLIRPLLYAQWNERPCHFTAS